MRNHRLQQVPQSSGSMLLARITKPDGEPLAAAETSSISLKVYDYRDMSTVVATATLTPADVLQSTLQTDARWQADGTGYNFSYQILPAQIPKRGKIYRFEFAFTLTDSTVIRDYVEIPTDAIYSVTES